MLGLVVLGLGAALVALALREDARPVRSAELGVERGAPAPEADELRSVASDASSTALGPASGLPEPERATVVPPPRGAELTVRVLDRFGDPVAGFVLEAIALDAGGAILASGPLDAPDGTATWALPRAGEWALSAIAGELRSDPATVRAPGEVTLVLPKPGMVEGRVVDQRGAPVPAATIELERVFPAGRAWGRVKTVESDAHGLFLAPELEGGIWQVHAAAPGLLASDHAKVELSEGDRADVGDLVLHDGGVIEGHFRAEVRVPAGCRIALWSLRRRGEQCVAVVEGSTFRFANLAGGAYVLALGPGPVPTRRLRGRDFSVPPLFVEEVAVREGATTRVELGGGDEVEPMHGERDASGTVGGSDGWILVLDEQVRACRLDAEGGFSARVGVGPFVLVAMVPGGCVAFQDLWQLDRSEPLELTVPPGVLEGRFTSAPSPRHVTLVEVSLFGTGQEELIASRHAVVGPDGSFRIEGLRPADYLIYADDSTEHAGHVSVGAEGVTRVSLR